MSGSPRPLRFSLLLSLIVLGTLVSGAARAATYYLDSQSGNDANNGLSPATAWRSLGKASSSISGTGHDVLLRSGRVFENQALTVSWSGSETDWVNVGCYNVNSSGQPVACGTADPKPEINGTLELQCVRQKTCRYNAPGAVPATMDLGLIHVWGDYIAVRDILLRDSAGAGLKFDSERGVTKHHMILENMVLTHIFQTIVLVGPNYQHGVIRNVHGYEYALCAQYGYPECSVAGWPGGIAIHDSPRAMILLENNLVHDGFGEAFNCLRSTHIVMRGNRAGNVHSNPYYLDNCSNVVVENNIGWGDLGGRWGANRAFAGVNVSTEDYNDRNIGSSINNIIRNNLITGVGYCVDSGQWDRARERGFKIGYHFYGNTCVGLQRRNVSIYSTTQVDQIRIQNNIFYSPGSMEGSCSVPINPNIRFDSNLWDNGTKTNICNSATDLNEDPKLVTSLADIAKLNSTNLPKPIHFALQQNSPVLSRGKDVISGDLPRLTDYAPFELLVKDRRCEVSTAGMPQDFFCVDRRSPPSLGAMDRAKYPPRAPQILSTGG